MGQLWRYPVKSLVGERVAAVEIDARGVVGDRLWSVRDEDGKFGSGKSTRRFRRMDGLLELSATYAGDVPVISFPDGRSFRADDEGFDAALSAHVGRTVSLGKETTISHFDEGPLHVLTEGSQAQIGRALGRDVDPRRLRPNIVVATESGPGLPEDRWIGSHVAVGDRVVLAIRVGMTRCVMVDLPQIGLGREGGILKGIAEFNDSRLGVVADVIRGGVVREGDPIRVMAQAREAG
ncbi:MAG: MOSC domain-containing protein [Actinobacteria bacterium]|nr:MOSC domain-containing protein [Actinomycetota bacterium]